MTLLTEPTRIVLAKGQPVPNDPSFASNSLLLHGNGTNGSTVITDSSGSPKAVTAFGNAQISTAQSKPGFGGASIAFDGNGDFLSANAADLALQSLNFTTELWVYVNAYSVTYSTFVDFRTDSNENTDSFGWAISSAGVLGFFSGLFIIQQGVVTAGQWVHLALVRNGTSFTQYINGQAAGTGTSSNSFTRSALAIGCTPGTFFLNGYIDDLRITKGVARYTANFTPPTAPFPDF
jgi:hypothetical protein